MKSGSLKLLETSGPHRASYGTPFQGRPLGLENTVTWSQSLAKTDCRHFAVPPLREFVEMLLVTQFVVINISNTQSTQLNDFIKMYFLHCFVQRRFGYNVIIIPYNFNIIYNQLTGARGGVVVKALRYKPAGHGFDSRWCHWNFSVT